MAIFRSRFIGVNRRRFGLIPPDLSYLDGVRSRVGATFTLRKNRTPRRLKVLPPPTRHRLF